ncbi:MAG: hypothetical protein J6U20_04770 [Fibrobacter sp.]|nr:hypothetical protein [Fibrobacter sp.]
MKRFVAIFGATALLSIIGCSGGSWEETNAFTPVADASVSGASSETENILSSGSSSPADVAYSDATVDIDPTVEPTSSRSDGESLGPAGNADGPKGGAYSSAATLSPSSYAVPTSSAATPRSSASSSTLPTNIPDTTDRNELPTSSEMDTTYIPFAPPVVETVIIGSQVWMKNLAVGGRALTWDDATVPGLCPERFHVPSYAEVDSLLHMAADGSIVGSENDGIGIITGGSKRLRDLGWSEHFGRFWTTEEFGESGAYYFAVSDTEDDALLHGDQKTNEYYVRCIKD